ncbi:ABC transporter ATP-binding protein [Rhodococcus fascians]|uniref:ABC transporter ATP-binding protein n=1 Tax=Rhodococcoides fascians TaxID=1828 RepID=UPI0019601F3B|nr:ABC transporter ATP-binding protein [Rhodococcus fascians]MBM7246191.1 ABC transporter ATP-binding protein [Rhodococcus fascians]MBY3811944.1 ABC transporter ATP-binding protein [Rhodococcus fascians]MBY3843577.1 ABC transporter ATP-binding protein [Rhodococcus fascians]MBY3848330.1 ABC transporter ATP-binding protein [Rhodococcus fascians]MBY3853174.1 ABC transporter ATP-binding protein [Rhodococcus fascians]
MAELEHSIDISALRKSFGGKPVLDGVSFGVRPGEFVSIIGPSGSGKSTVFNMLAGLDTPDSGSVRVPPCAYMPQKDLLFPWRSVLDNTSLGLEVQGVAKKEARARARELFPVFGLDGYESARPSELSGGMRQRAALLRTVVQGRSVLLLDEPFGALDSLTRSDMQAWLQQVWSEFRWTVLMITHDIREAVYLSDRVVVLSPRPAHVRRQVDVPLPRPRELEIVTTPQFAAVEKQLIEVLSSTPNH